MDTEGLRHARESDNHRRPRGVLEAVHAYLHCASAAERRADGIYLSGKHSGRFTPAGPGPPEPVAPVFVLLLVFMGYPWRVSLLDRPVWRLDRSSRDWIGPSRDWIGSSRDRACAFWTG